MQSLLIIAAAVFMVMLGGYALKQTFQRVVIWEYQKGLRYRKGKFVGVIGAGSYTLLRTRDSITPVDMRPQFLTVTGQEALTSDSVGIKLSVTAKYRIEDPEAAIHGIQQYYQGIYLILQNALREIVGAKTIDELLESRSTIDAFLLERCAPEIKEFGIELNYATIRDITFPGELKKVFAQSVAARKEGLAALERARGETAALRNLANAAALIRDNPALLQLRAIQAVSEGSGATLVLGAPFSEAIVRPKPPAS